jgi:hypothetical protein
MATKAQIDLLVNTAESANTLKEFRQNINNIQKAISEATDPADVKRLTNALAQGREGAADFSDRLRALGANNFERLAMVGQSVSAGFQVATSAAALFGEESENLQKTLLKVQSAMALTQGLGELAEAPRKIKDVAMAFGLVSVAKKIDNTTTQESIVTDGLKTTSLTTQTTATNAATVATKGLSLSMKALGIGLLISAVAALVVYWDDLVKVVGKVTGGVDNMKIRFAGFIAIAKEIGSALLTYIAAPYKALYKLFTDGPSAAADELKSAFNKIKETIANSGAAGQAAQEAKKIQLSLEKQIEDAEKASKKLEAGSLKRLQSEKSILDLKLKLAKQNGDDTSSIEEEIDKKTVEINKKREGDTKEFNRRKKEATDKALSDAIAAIDEETGRKTLHYKTQKEKDDNALLDLKDNLQKKIEETKKFGKSTTDLELKLKETQAAINKKSYDESIALLEKEFSERQNSYKTREELEKNREGDELEKSIRTRDLMIKNGQDTTAINKQIADAERNLTDKTLKDKIAAVDTELAIKKSLYSTTEEMNKKSVDDEIESTIKKMSLLHKQSEEYKKLEIQLRNLQRTSGENAEATAKENAQITKSFGEISNALSPDEIQKFFKMTKEEQEKFISDTKTRIEEYQATMKELSVGPNLVKVITGIGGEVDPFQAMNELADFASNIAKQMTETNLLELQNETQGKIDILNQEEETRLRGIEKGSSQEAKIKEDFEKKRKKLAEDGVKEERRIRKEFALFEADMGIARIGIATAEAIVKAAPNPFAIAFAAATGALQLGLAINNRATIAAQKAEKGGFLKGPSHAEGGIMLTPSIEAEGGEFIVNKTSTMRFSDTIQSINNDGGDALLSELRAMRSELSNPVRSYVVFEDIEKAGDQREFIKRRTEF